MDIKDLEEKMKLTLSNMISCAELSLRLKAENPEHSKRITKYWTDFGKHFISNVKKLEKETGEEMLPGHYLSSLMKFLK